MLQELLSLLPRELGMAALVLGVLLTMCGLGLWLIGSRYARSIITLTLVSVGAGAGLALPRWCGWSIDGWATSVGAAVVLGVSGYVMTRAWVGVGFGLVLACWAALIVWVACHGNESWNWPTVDAKTTLPKFVAGTWESLPKDVSKFLPWACAVAMVSGFAVTMLWPKLGGVLLFSSAGLSLAIATGLTLLETGRPKWLKVIPTASWAQAIGLIVLVLVGAFVQWRLFGPIPANSGGGKKSK